jgi:hypothetical protein
MTIQRQIGVHMSDDEMKLVAPADEVAFRSPVPTQVVSNGEYNPLPQTEDQKKVEGLIKELADEVERGGFRLVGLVLEHVHPIQVQVNLDVVLLLLHQASIEFLGFPQLLVRSERRR